MPRCAFFITPTDAISMRSRTPFTGYFSALMTDYRLKVVVDRPADLERIVEFFEASASLPEALDERTVTLIPRRAFASTSPAGRSRSISTSSSACTRASRRPSVLEHDFLWEDGAVREALKPIGREVERRASLEQFLRDRAADRGRLHEAVP
jgi:hypothetical protein